MLGCKDPLLYFDELLSNSKTLLLRVENTFERGEKLRFGFFHLKVRCPQLAENSAHEVGFAFAHQPGIDIQAVHALRTECSQTQRVCNGGIDPAAHKKKHAAPLGCASNV